MRLPLGRALCAGTPGDASLAVFGPAQLGALSTVGANITAVEVFERIPAQLARPGAIRSANSHKNRQAQNTAQRCPIDKNTLTRYAKYTHSQPHHP